MNVLDHSTRNRTVGSTTAFATGGTTAGYALAVLAYELFHLPLSTEGVLALALVLSLVGAVLGGWFAPSKKADVEAYLGSVMAMAQYGDHGRLSSATVATPSVDSSDESSTSGVYSEYEPLNDGVLVDTAGTAYSDPAYARS